MGQQTSKSSNRTDGDACGPGDEIAFLGSHCTGYTAEILSLTKNGWLTTKVKTGSEGHCGFGAIGKKGEIKKMRLRKEYWPTWHSDLKMCVI